MTYTPGCWFAMNIIGSGPCDGRLRKCHLIPKQLLKREFGKELGARFAEDPATWVWGCGGIMGNAGHHGMLDASRTLRIPRAVVPAATEQFAADHALEWWLDREYGPRELAA